MDKILRAILDFFTMLGSLFAGRAAAEPVLGEPVPGPQVGASKLGIPINNPFNLEFRAHIDWQGQVGVDAEFARFVVFDKAVNGIRAGMINIHTKMTRDGLNTVRKIINRLSPPVENPTEAFVQFVAGQMGVAPDQPLQFSSHILAMSQAIIQFENGSQPYSVALLNQALQNTGKV
jgi:hypothetical protein